MGKMSWRNDNGEEEPNFTLHWKMWIEDRRMELREKGGRGSSNNPV
jgi:hypothetical protein